MKITIVGAGLVGTHLAKYLADEHMDIFVIDSDSRKLSMLDSEYNLMTIVGDGTVFSTLRQAEVETCDLFIAVTEVAERNIVSCGIAKSMGAKMTVARVDREDFLESYNQEVIHKMGVDHAIFPEYLSAQAIINSLKHSWTRNWYEFNHGKMIMVGVRIDEMAPLTGKYLHELGSTNRNFHVIAIRRDFETIIPNGNCRLQANDIVYITTKSEGIDEVARLTGKTMYEIKKVVIAGGGKITELTVGAATKQFKFTVIENDYQKAQLLTDKGLKCDVIYGDSSEFDVLNEAGTKQSEAFVAVKDTSEGNILACLSAREMGVRKTIADVEMKQFFNMAESFHIGTILNKQMLFANAVFQLLIDNSLASKCLTLPDAEVVMLEIKGNSKITKDEVYKLNLPNEITFAGMIRNGESELVTGKTRFKQGDQVLVVYLSGVLQKVKKIFN